MEEATEEEAMEESQLKSLKLLELQKEKKKIFLIFFLNIFLRSVTVGSHSDLLKYTFGLY